MTNLLTDSIGYSANDPTGELNVENRSSEVTATLDHSYVFTKAIVRAPAKTLAEGLTTVDMGTADYGLATNQHIQYCTALESTGVEIIQMNIDEEHPDSVFVEDTAIVSKSFAIIMNPGHPTRKGEVPSIQCELEALFGRALPSILSPGEVDGGDVCEAHDTYFVGLSKRTNNAGCSQLNEFLLQQGKTVRVLDIRKFDDILHLKSGLAYIGDNRLLAIKSVAQAFSEDFHGFQVIVAPDGEEYGVNCIRSNGHILLAAGHPQLQALLESLGYSLVILEMSEFRKVDGGLSCLSLRF